MEQRFFHIINSPKPVLVDFYADWCIPCREIPPVLSKVKEEIRGGFRIVKVNVDENPQIASHFKVNNIPTLILFRNGEPQWTRVGICKPEEIKTVLRSQISEG